MLKLLCTLLYCSIFNQFVIGDDYRVSVKQSTVVIAILARNKAHTLPYFLSIIDRLNYPKDRISLWIRSDHNTDNTIEILRAWIHSVKDEYHSISYVLDEASPKQFLDETGPAHWPPSRFNHVIGLREEAIQYARKMWADYILQIDCDVFLTNVNTLQQLIDKGLPIVAPMVKSDGLYSNFWHGMTEDYYYLRTEDYKPVLNRERVGCFEVPMIHSCVLVDLRTVQSDRLTYTPGKVAGYDGPQDDIITFALSANKSNIPLHVCNDATFGYVTVPLEHQDELQHDHLQLTNIKLEVLSEGEPLWLDGAMKRFVTMPAKDRLGFDKVYMINLRRRPERRVRMQACFDELALDVDTIDAVDGRALNETVLSGIRFMPEYADPYHGRPMTLGEIGCFLSHHGVWRAVAAAAAASASSAATGRSAAYLVLEDDIRFEPFFRLKVERLVSELALLAEWDLVYLGRKRLQEMDEPWVEGSRMLVHAGYSYWTLGYVLSGTGARKLLAGRPLHNMVPVDEYLPILFDRHPRVAWKGYYPRRDLVALSAAPLLLFPTHYTGERGYVSDTEDSDTVVEQLHEAPSSSSSSPPPPSHQRADL